LSFFFFLSGYLITTLLRLEAEHTGKVDLRGFYLRRVFRIFPPFYTVLALALGLAAVGVLRGPDNLSAWPYQVLHLTNYYIIQAGWWNGLAPGTWVYWSLAVEEHFYLGFPFLYLLLRNAPRRRQALVLWALCAVVLAWRCWLVFGLHASHERLYVATDTRVDSILFGCALALWGNPALDPTPVSDRGWLRGWLPAGLGLLLLSVVIRNPQYEQTLRYTLQGIALTPLFIVAVRYPDWGAIRFLNHRVMRLLGMLSYSLYLLHTPVIHGVQQWIHAPALAQGSLAMIICFLGALGMFYAVEMPSARLRKRLTARPDRSQGSGTSIPTGSSMAPEGSSVL
jgi:peptidoglycan/LPS O-acetylase OafA/YrhL